MFNLQFLNHWMPTSPTGYIIAGILAVVLIYLTFWMVYGIVYLCYWLTSEILRGTFFGLSIMGYSLWVVFVSAPIGLLLRDETLGTISRKYGQNVKMAVFIFYPKLKENAEKRAKKTQSHVPAKESSSKSSISNSRSQELSVQTEIAKYSSINHSATKPKITFQKNAYFCSQCGKAFTESMYDTLKVKGYTFCEGCGKRFNLVQNFPIPQ